MCESFIQMETMPHLREKISPSHETEAMYLRDRPTETIEETGQRSSAFRCDIHLVYVREEKREKRGRGCEGGEGGETAEREVTGTYFPQYLGGRRAPPLFALILAFGGRGWKPPLS